MKKLLSVLLMLTLLSALLVPFASAEKDLEPITLTMFKGEPADQPAEDEAGHHPGIRQRGQDLGGCAEEHHPDHARYDSLRHHRDLHGADPGGLSLPAEVLCNRYGPGFG